MVCKMSVRKGFSVLPFTHSIKWIAADMALPAHQHNKLSNLRSQTAAAIGIQVSGCSLSCLIYGLKPLPPSCAELRSSVLNCGVRKGLSALPFAHRALFKIAVIQHGM